MTAYDASGNVLGISFTGGPNYSEVGTPNMLLEVSSGTAIASVVFHDSGNTFTVDDLYFDSQQSCQVSGTPLYKQQDPAWGDDLYGGSSSNPWIDPDTHQPAKLSRWGCALTSAAMIVSYYGLLQNGFTTNPHLLNDWLKQHGGYSGGDIYWDRVADYARTVGNL
jgi:hypothetical protein